MIMIKIVKPYGHNECLSILQLFYNVFYVYLQIKGMNADDYLGIITFGTKAKVVLPLAKLSSDTIKV